MQEELPWNLAEGAANPYPLAVKPRDIPSNKRDMQLIKIKYCVDTSFTKRQKRHENDVKICYCLAYSNTMKPFTPSCLLGGATGTSYSSHIRNPLHSLGVTGHSTHEKWSLHAIRSATKADETLNTSPTNIWAILCISSTPGDMQASASQPPDPHWKAYLIFSRWDVMCICTH